MKPKRRIIIRAMKAKASKFASFFGLLCLLLLTGVLPCQAGPETGRAEEQRHGYVFEKWVRDTFFDGYVLENYTQLWDVPKDKNKNYGGIPVQIKMTKYGTAVDLGDALRQFQIDENFLLIIGYWKQEGDKKRIVNLVPIVVESKLWRRLWQPIEWQDLKTLDAVIKDRTRDYKDVRADAKKHKRRAPFSQAQMVLNPKIDSKTQRRLQCSLRFDDVFEYLAPKADPLRQENPTLFGVAALPPFFSPARR